MLSEDNMTDDPFNLQRFIDAQNKVYKEEILPQLCSGRKATHWMWFVFPQLKGLGASENSEFYGISGLDEARAYMANKTLRSRYISALNLVIRAGGPEKVFNHVDQLKFRSSLELFGKVASLELFGKIEGLP